MTIQILPGCDQPQHIRQLFAEYTDLVIQGDSTFRDYLTQQNYEDELSHLEHKYGAPYGRLYLACCNGKPAGCIALRRLDETRCEMKRLYVRPNYRKQKIGGRLVDLVFEDAKSIGYTHMLLDTFPFLDTAIRMYKARGFYEIPRYNDSPMDCTIYLQLDL